MDRQALVVALDLAGVACSTGSACASGSSEPSPVLLAMGCDKTLVSGSIRLSLGCLSSVAEVDLATQRILKTVNDLQHASQTRKLAPTPPSPPADRL
jgi:cysteine desulfurase